MIVSSISCCHGNLADTCTNHMFGNHYHIFIYQMLSWYLCLCLLFDLSRTTLNKITDVILYNEAYLYICLKTKDLLCNQL
uniref:Uncharacterized protein n=1 Tax=Mus spicilegus TaxID=10103 RepID=A0A8C6MRE2_MUSSI